MVNVIKLRKGLNINLKGNAVKEIVSVVLPSEIGFIPTAFEGVVPKVIVKEGDVVKAGDTLFVNKAFPAVKFSSPVSGKITAIDRKSTRLNSSHANISYAVFCLKKK